MLSLGDLGYPLSLGDREKGIKQWPMPRTIFIPVETWALSWGRRFDTVSEFDAFKSEGAPLFEINPR